MENEEFDFALADGEPLGAAQNNEVEDDKSELINRYIVSVVPLIINNYHQSQIKILLLLAKTANGELIIIQKDYLSFYELPPIPFDSDTCYISNDIASRIIYDACNSERYASNLKFSIDDDKAILHCHKLDDNKTKTDIYMPINLFASISMIDYYINIFAARNNEDLKLAIIDGYSNDKFELNYITDIEKIICMAPINKTNIEVIIKIKDESEDEYNLLLTFNVGVKFRRRKFKGIKISDINNNFFLNDNEYIENYQFNSDIENDDSYVIFKASNKNKKKCLFLFNKDLMDTLTDMIERY